MQSNENEGDKEGSLWEQVSTKCGHGNNLPDAIAAAITKQRPGKILPKVITAAITSAAIM
jgi:hypothetical protein